MYNPFKKVTPGSLEAALEACNIANKQGYSEAKIYLKDLKKSIAQASEIITECIDGMTKYKINDKSLVDNIRTQLQTVQTEFEQSYFDTQASLRSKNKMSSYFNITLFGKTKAGKSTLMEILTHGDGSHMGKGGQRTTRDVRSYEWRGMSVTDVPGIDAYGGQEDDAKAEEAAIYADLILFMITAGQPEGSEADWMVKLKKMDKPILCVCNYKQSLGEGVDDFRLKRLLSNPQKLEERMNIGELVKQFNTFLNEQLPNEHVDFIITHLLAKFCSQQPEYASKKLELEKVSRFEHIEQSLINEVYTNGVLHRKKCYLSIIDAPLYQQMNQLFDFSSDAYSQFRMILDKVSIFSDWCETFNKNEKNNIVRTITKEYNKLRNSVPGFVEKHLEDDDVDNAWKTHCANFNTQYAIENSVNSTKNKLEEKVNDIFTELKAEMNFSFKWKVDNNLGNYQFINWKRGIKWASALGSAGLGIAAIALSSGPLGWAALGVTAIFGFFSWLCDSREDKLRERRKKLSSKINDGIDKEEQKAKDKISTWFDDNIVKQEEQISKRLSVVGRGMLSLSNGERQLALGYCKNHRDITKMIIANIFNAMGIFMNELDRIVCAARVPGRRIAIILEGRENLPLKISELSSRLGNNEEISIIKLDRSKSLEVQIVYLLKYFGFMIKPLIKKVNNDTQTVVYLFDQGYNQKDLDSLNLIQQIMNVHIILK
ncbi:GTPase domain-containing protein [Prevotella pallens]|jgi:putative GTPase|uniref:GTPase domain-containing protein n=1 Tax=Prevotella pallens TaxID=60133 RepID=UPI001CB3E397|nr:GTPase domain-containing protein [Prevotella pallens]MBF1502587.1 GTPase domain-containing protein [Prevotella pallens]